MGGSSSHRRKGKGQQRLNRNGNSAWRKARSSSDSTVKNEEFSTTRVLHFEDHAITGGFGHEILEKYGWVSGSPLGGRRNLENDSEASSGQESLRLASAPIPITVRGSRAGLGARSLVISDRESNSSGLRSPRPSSLPTSMTQASKDGRGDISQMSSTAIFDPLRPRCRFDDSHVVPSLKALHKHEKCCPKNPNRTGSKLSQFSCATRSPATVTSFTMEEESTWIPAHSVDSFSDTSLSDSESDTSTISSSTSSTSGDFKPEISNLQS